MRARPMKHFKKHATTRKATEYVPEEDKDPDIACAYLLAIKTNDIKRWFTVSRILSFAFRAYFCCSLPVHVQTKHR